MGLETDCHRGHRQRTSIGTQLFCFGQMGSMEAHGGPEGKREDRLNPFGGTWGRLRMA